MNKLFRKILWFEKRNVIDIQNYDIFIPQRIVSKNPRYKNGIFFSPKCKRDIQYESGLELEFIHKLEACKKVKFYWEQPCTIPYWRGKVKDNYTPDFGLYLTTGEIVIIEIKTFVDMFDYRVQMKLEGLMKFCNQKGFGILLTDGKQTLDNIWRVENNRHLEKAILTALSRTPKMRKEEYIELMHECNASLNQLLKVVARNKLKYRSYSKKIELVNKNKLFCHVFFDRKPYDTYFGEKYTTLFKSK